MKAELLTVAPDHVYSKQPLSNNLVRAILSENLGKKFKEPSFRYFRHLMALVFATKEINHNPEILPNITLGYEIYDSCSSVTSSILGTLSILSNKGEPVPNYSCHRKSILAGFIGDISSVTSYEIAQLVKLYKYPQISYGALDPLLTENIEFPSFYRTVPNERSHYAGIAQVLEHFGWTWVGILTSDDDSGERAVQELRKVITQTGGCVEFTYRLDTEINIPGTERLKIIINAIRKATAQVIILSGTGTSMMQYFLHRDWEDVPPKIWIASVTVSSFKEYYFEKYLNIFNGSLSFSIKTGKIIGFKEFLYDIKVSMFRDYDVFDSLWEDAFKCKLMDRENPTYLYTEYISHLPYCSGNETLQSLDSFIYDVFNFRFTHRVYVAVYAMAHALHDMYLSDPKPGAASAAERPSQEHRPWKLNRYLRNLHSKTPAGDELSFDDKGDVPAQYDIMNSVYFPNGSMKNIEVGHYDSGAPAGHQLFIKDNSILWHSDGGIMKEAPRSVCSESCLPGYRKAPIKQMPTCCFDCVPCAEGEFSNSTGECKHAHRMYMINCMKCPEDQSSNIWKDGCIHKITVYLSYYDSLGMGLAFVAVVLSIITTGVLGIFLQYRDTPIVKANNRDLSYTLLISLMLTFLCSLLFIGRPTTCTCLSQQTAFGIIFTAAVSCVLSKTITVVIAFNATKPGSRWSRWLGPRMSFSMVLVCTLGEVVICLTWLLTSPPHPHTDTQSERGRIILQCDVGSIIAFYIVIGYMGLLALASFMVAFFARNLPDRFNEAQLITFSMLVFCSVWVSFIPAYLSTKGRYMVAVEIFAMLASSAGLLGCIFIPKCYIILLRPDINTKEYGNSKNN
ncbi:extracellular calcium-sensing receptor-like [Ambystoma mexicanum]|uniref:extracellular calcium-sensing receptor-like n=1 Tax=Ambystoma mexicanum TaxID=8296 RepID=UPI0037E867D3